MINEANAKQILLLATTAVATNATSTASFDTSGFDFAQVVLHNASTGTFGTLKIEQSDDDSSYAAVSGLTGGTDFTIAAAAATTNAKIPHYIFNIDTRGLRRYLKLTVQATGTTASCTAWATLGRRAIGVNTVGTSTTVDTRAIISV